jgi:ABC-type Na+ efflux pump permease subunit
VAALLNHVRKDLIRHRREPLAFLVWLGIPLLIGALFTLLFGGDDGPRPTARLLIVDEDQSLISGLLVRALSEQNTRGLIHSETVAADEGRRQLGAGKASALLTLPAGFDDAILREQPLALPLLINPAERILPRLVEETLGLLVDGHFYLHRLVGEDLRWLATLGRAPTDAEIAAFSGRLRERLARLGRYVNPPLIQVADEAPPPGEATRQKRSPALLFVPGLLFMALLFMAQGLAREFWDELEQHTLHRILVTPAGAGPFLLGKLVAGWLLMLAVAGISLGLGLIVFKLPAAIFLPALLWASLAGIVFLAAFTLLSLAMPTARATNMVGMALLFPLMMIGGSFFPLEAMPPWMGAIGAWTPNGWALQRLKEILGGELAPLGFAGGLLALVAVTAALTLLGTRRLRARFERG